MTPDEKINRAVESAENILSIFKAITKESTEISKLYGEMNNRMQVVGLALVAPGDEVAKFASVARGIEMGSQRPS